MQRMCWISFQAGVLFLAVRVARSEPVLTDTFEEQGMWQHSIKGEGSLTLVSGGVTGKCL